MTTKRTPIILCFAVVGLGVALVILAIAVKGWDYVQHQSWTIYIPLTVITFIIGVAIASMFNNRAGWSAFGLSLILCVVFIYEGCGGMMHSVVTWGIEEERKAKEDRGRGYPPPYQPPPSTPAQTQRPSSQPTAEPTKYAGPLPTHIGDLSVVGGTVSDVKFFESGQQWPNDNEKVYASTFSASNTRFVNWEVWIAYQPQNKIHFVNLDVMLINDRSGQLLERSNIGMSLPPIRTSFFQVGRFGMKWEGNWKPGRYEVQVHIGGQKQTSAFFTIEN